MALVIDAVPEEIAKLRGAVEAMLERHRNLRVQFGAAVLAIDDVTLQTIRARLTGADSEIEAAYGSLRAATERFGSDVCAAVRDLLADEAAPLIGALPKEVEETNSALGGALARRRELQTKAAESAAAEPAFLRAVETSQIALDNAEMDLALATDENEKKLRGVRDRLGDEFRGVEEQLKTIQMLRRGLAARADRVETEILEAKGPFDRSCQSFCDEILAGYRELLCGAIFGNAAGFSFARGLRLGYALQDALPFARQLRSMLDEVSVPDPGPAPGRPVPRFIKGDRAWPDDTDLAGIWLREWQDDPEIAALHALLKPLAANHAAATVQIRQIEAKRIRDAEAANRAARSGPAKPEPPPQPRTMTSAEHEAWLKSQPTADEHREIVRKENAERAEKNRIYPPLGERPSWHGPRFADTNLA
jgi:hypothetical protein